MSATALATVTELPTSTPVTTPKPARKPRTPKPETPATKPQTDAKPETPQADAKKVATLESIAARLRNAGVAKLSEFGQTVAKLAAMRAWTVTDVTAKDYFRALGVGGDNITWPLTVRQAIVKAIWDADNSTSLEVYIAATATGERTVKRDKTAVGAVNQARVEGQKSDGDTDGDTDGDVTPPVEDAFAKQRAMLAKLDDSTLADLIIAAGRGPSLINAIALNMATPAK